MDVTAHLEHLRDELIRRDWKAEVPRICSRVVLRVESPTVARLNDEIACDGRTYRWAWDQGIGWRRRGP